MTAAPVAPRPAWTPVPDGLWIVLRNALAPHVIGGFVVPGNPKPKGRPRLGAGGHVITPKTTKTAEKRVAEAFASALPGWQAEPDGTYGVMIQFNTEEGSLADLDNLTKLVWDALNKRFWVDDIQVGYAFLRLIRGGDPDTHVILFGARNNGTPLTKVCECGTRYRSRRPMCETCTSRRSVVAALLRETETDEAAAELERLKRAAFSYLTACMIGNNKAPTLKAIAQRIGVTEARARTVIDALIETGAVARENRKLKIVRPLGDAA